MGAYAPRSDHPRPDPDALRAKIVAAGPNEYVEVTREEFDVIRREAIQAPVVGRLIPKTSEPA